MSVPKGDSQASSQGALAAFGHLPISFEVNQGQVNSQVRFLAHGSGYNLFLTPTEALLAVSGATSASATSQAPFVPAIDDPVATSPASSSSVVGMQFLNANSQPQITGEQQLPGVVNYFVGRNQANWHTNIPTYAQVRYHNLYPGIDLVYYGNQGHLEYDFVVAPGSNPSRIRLNFTGTDHLSVDAQGQLLLHLSNGDFPEGVPHIYQEVDGARQAVAGSYVLKGSTQVGFALGVYDPTRPLIIDPLIYATYLGGSNIDYGYNMALDSAGNTYITGTAGSPDFPLQNPLQSTVSGMFVTKLNATGSALVYSTYLGDSGLTTGSGIAVDRAGNVYITGYVDSSDYPLQNALQPTYGGGPRDAFVTELNAAGNALVYSTYLGGSFLDYGVSIAVDSAGNAYVTGYTASTNFPLQNPFQSKLGGCCGAMDAFVTKIASSGSALVYSTYFGGGGVEVSYGIAIDNAGDAYIIGYTSSSDFPVQNALQPTFGGGSTDGFVTKLNAAGSALIYSTYLGGSDDDQALGIAVDQAGNAYVTGYTRSSNFPAQNALQPKLNGTSVGNAFVTKLNATGSAFIYSTYLGGSGGDGGRSIAVDDAGNVYVMGTTSSSDFPLYNALQSKLDGPADAFVTKLDATGSSLLYSTFLGGSSYEEGVGIAVDSTGNAYVMGTTTSTDFPIVGSPFQSQNNGLRDVFVAKISPKGTSTSPNLLAIDRNNTQSGTTEVNVLSGANNFQSFLLQTPTALGQTGTDGSWAFLLADYNGDGIPDLWAIKKANTGSGTTEVHILNGANNFQTWLLHTATALGQTGTDASWQFLVGDYNRDGHPDLWVIKKANTGSKTTEVHILNGANFQSFLLHTATALQQTGTDSSWNFGLGDYNGDGHPDLWAIDKANMSSGMTEVSILNGTNFQAFLTHSTTALGTTGTDNSWVFLVGDYNGDGHPDLWAINKANTSSGTTEVHILNGTNFQAVLVQTVTALQQTGTDNSWVFALG
jgi:hypothetical protein